VNERTLLLLRIASNRSITEIRPADSILGRCRLKSVFGPMVSAFVRDGSLSTDAAVLTPLYVHTRISRERRVIGDQFGK
jgi:hypothetical protein